MTGNPQDSDGSSASVFAVPELLEMILGSAPTRGLFCAQKVNKLWRDMITTSSKLQQDSFLKPKLAKKAWILAVLGHDYNQDWWYDNGLQSFILYSNVFPIMSVAVDEVDEVQVEESEGHLITVALNDLLLDTTDHPLPRDRSCLDDGIGGLKHGEQVALRLNDNPTSSYAAMYLCQPPAETVGIFVYYPIEVDGLIGVQDYWFSRLENPKGVQYREVIKAIREVNNSQFDLSEVEAFVQLESCASVSAKQEDMINYCIREGWKGKDEE